MRSYCRSSRNDQRVLAASEPSFDFDGEILPLDGDRHGGRERLCPRVEHQYRHIPSRDGTLFSRPVHPQCPDDNTPLHCMTISPDGESVSILSFFLSLAAHRLQQERQRVHLEILEHRDSAASEVPRPRRIRAFLQGFHDKQVGFALEFEVERLLRRRPIAASSCGTWIRWRSRS